MNEQTEVIKACGECSMNVSGIYGQYVHTYGEGCHASKKEELDCGCRKGICMCDPERCWPPTCCKKCPRINPQMRKRIKTPYKDLSGEIICVGDIILFGILEQHWKIKKAEKKSKFIMQIVSKDSGNGWTERMEDMSFELPENNTYICQANCYKNDHLPSL